VNKQLSLLTILTIPPFRLTVLTKHQIAIPNLGRTPCPKNGNKREMAQGYAGDGIGKRERGYD
jgi:hypothetical protein